VGTAPIASREKDEKKAGKEQKADGKVEKTVDSHGSVNFQVSNLQGLRLRQDATPSREKATVKVRKSLFVTICNIAAALPAMSGATSCGAAGTHRQGRRFW